MDVKRLHEVELKGLIVRRLKCERVLATLFHCHLQTILIMKWYINSYLDVLSKCLTRGSEEEEFMFTLMLRKCIPWVQQWRTGLLPYDLIS